MPATTDADTPPLIHHNSGSPDPHRGYHLVSDVVITCGAPHWQIEATEWDLVTCPRCKARRLLGKQVQLDLGSKTVVAGKLLAFADDGSVAVEDSEGAVHHCWPMLDIKAREDRES